MSTREHIKNIINKYTTGNFKVISGVDFANKLGVTVSAVNKWKTGETTPNVELFEEICKIFGISINEFLNIYNDNVITKEDKKYLEIIKSNPTLVEILNKVAK